MGVRVFNPRLSARFNHSMAAGYKPALRWDQTYPGQIYAADLQPANHVVMTTQGGALGYYDARPLGFLYQGSFGFTLITGLAGSSLHLGPHRQI